MLTPDSLTKKQLYTSIGALIFAAITLFVVLPQLDSFKDSLAAVREADLWLTAAAVAAALSACVMSAMLYVVIARKPLKIGTTIKVQLSGLFVNRILPAGIGGLGLNVWYLRKRKHNLAQATLVVSLNNLLGFVGHMLLLIVFAAIFSMSGVRRAELPEVGGVLYLILGIVALIALVVFIFRARIKKFGTQLKRELGKVALHFARRPDELLLAITLSCVMTLCNVLSFWLCCQALGLPLDFAVVFFIFTFGVLLGTATPTPGGLGGVEAALFAGLISQSVSPANALAAALLYRLASYWIGLLIGLMASISLRKQFS